MQKTFTYSNFYLLLLLLSFLGGRLFPMYVAKVIMIATILLSLFYFFEANAKYTLPLCFKSLNVLVLLFTVYGIAFLIKGDMHFSGGVVSSTSYLLDVYLSLLPSYAFFVFAKRGMLTEKLMGSWLIIFLFATIFIYFRVQSQVAEMLYKMGVSDVDNITNNTGYVFVGLLPALVVFRKKPIVQYLFLLICGTFTLLSVKRGAILIFAVVLVVFILNNLKEGASGRNKTKIILLSIIIIIASVWFVEYLLVNNDFFVQRLNQTAEGNSSGRDNIQRVYFYHFINENNLWRFLFGNGANGGLAFAGASAHNDWLEIAISQGAVGLVIYFLYWVNLYKTYRNTKNHVPSPNAIGIFIIIYFTSTWFSMSFNSITGPSNMVLGYYLATYGFGNKELIKHQNN